jgi:hypothetical protein
MVTIRFVCWERDEVLRELSTISAFRRVDTSFHLAPNSTVIPNGHTVKDETLVSLVVERQRKAVPSGSSSSYVPLR